MLDTMTTPSTRVAILATSEKTQQQLAALLQDAGLDVVAHDLPSDGFLSQLEQACADVLLVDLSEENGSETDIIDTLLDFDALPIFFNDSSPAGGGANATWAKKLARKLSSVAESFAPPVTAANEELTNTQSEADFSALESVADLDVTEAPADEPVTPNTTVLQTSDIHDADLLDEPLTFEELSLDETPTDDTSNDDLSLDTPLEEEPALSELSLEPLVDSDTALTTKLDLALEVDDESHTTELTIETEPQVVNVDYEIESAAEPLQTTTATEKPEGAADNIWVLGASLGGPQAVRQFLAAIKEDLPVAFVLAQHIGANHISLLAEQLNRVTPFTVVEGKAGHLIKHYEVVLAPADKDIRITDDGYLSLVPADENAIYSPSIDNVMDAIASHYGKMAGTIIFSGMGDDGARGCESIAKYGGIVWAQDVDSCVISSMPDQARKTNTVTYSANPQALAERLYNYYHD